MTQFGADAGSITTFSCPGRLAAPDSSRLSVRWTGAVALPRSVTF